jgi:serine/threonine protein kinase
MPAPTTTDAFLETVRKSGLIPAQRLEAFVVQAREAVSAGTPREMARLLVAAGLITHFQAEQFLQGKHRGFTIGKYKVLERLGSGGMGTVYLCEHMQVGRKAAIKVLPNSQATNPAALGRFYREARAAGVLDHPNLVKAHDIDTDGGLHFLVMDYVDGSSLQHLVARFGPLAVERACHYTRQAAVGLHAAHQAGLLHRDIKPANIMLERNGTVRVLDLGLARFIHDTTDQLTLKYDDRNVLGTADFVAPEQALNSHEVDARADVYSLGATLYFLLAGHPPFPDGKIAQKLIWHQVRQPTPIRQLRAEVPVGLALVLDKMLAKNPAQRYQSAADVVQALAPWAATPLGPPPEEEMPRLSPAAGQGAGTAAAGRPGGGRAAGAVKADGGSSRVGTLDRPPSVSDLPTPAVLSTRPTLNDNRLPVATLPVAPSHVLGHAARLAAESRGGGVRRAVLLAALALAGGAVGVALTWWFVGR